MRILFLHNNFPAQYRHLASALARDPNNEVVFGTQAERNALHGVKKALYKPHREVKPETHPYLRGFETAVLNAQAVFRMCLGLKKAGFVPDIVYGHSGWGPTLFVRDAFPDCKLISYFEWFYKAHGSDVGFLRGGDISNDDLAQIRVKNAPILMDLELCHTGVVPTQWQCDQFPQMFHPKLNVIHDGVDTDFFKPVEGAKLVIPSLDLSEADEIVTYVARGMEPYRGFPQFMETAAILQKRRPNVHIVVVGSDRVAYGRKLPDGQTYKEKMLAELDFDLERIHFTGSLPYGEYLKVVQASSVHVYLTIPFVLSWSMIETLSVGGLIVGSDTPPVREVIEDGRNGLLVDFFSPEQIADRVEEALDHPDRMRDIRARARETVLERYDLRDRLVDLTGIVERTLAGEMAAAS
jgi:glycosyltransferase involved in cell wall biosynthesis